MSICQRPAAFASMVFFLFIFACRPDQPSTSSIKGLANSTVIPWPNGMVDICWARHDFSDVDELKKYLEHNIVKEFSRAGIKIQGWKECPDHLDAAGPYPLKLGSDGNFTVNVGYASRFGGVQLDIVNDLFALPSSSSPQNNNCKEQGSKLLKKECILGTALHEFGHFVGLLHEHERTDVWERCIVDAFHPRKYETHFGDYDADSIMNYCVDDGYIWGTAPVATTLSMGDVLSIRTLYNHTATFLSSNAKRPGSFIDQDHLVVEVTSRYTASYRYQILYSETIRDPSCSLEGYSREHFPASQTISMDLRAYKSGVIKVCVLGTNHEGIEQSAMAYSSVSFIIDKTPWAKVTDSERIVQTDIIQVSGEGIVSYVYKLVNVLNEKGDFSTPDSSFKTLNPCLFEEGYSLPLPVSEALSLVNLEADQQYLGCVRGIDANGKMQSRIKTTQFIFDFEPSEL